MFTHLSIFYLLYSRMAAVLNIPNRAIKTSEITVTRGEETPLMFKQKINEIGFDGVIKIRFVPIESGNGGIPKQYEMYRPIRIMHVDSIGKALQRFGDGSSIDQQNEWRKFIDENNKNDRFTYDLTTVSNRVLILQSPNGFASYYIERTRIPYKKSGGKRSKKTKRRSRKRASRKSRK